MLYLLYGFDHHAKNIFAQCGKGGYLAVKSFEATAIQKELLDQSRLVMSEWQPP